MVGAAGAELGEAGVLSACEEVEDDLGIREVPDLRVVGRDESA
jgi:hypothetical protein